MAKVHLPKLNSWLVSLVLVSIGLHGLVLALPMPSSEESEPEKTEHLEPDVIQVVTLPKLATGPAESEEPSLPDPPEEEQLEEPEALLEEPVVTDPHILDNVEPPESESLKDIEEPKNPEHPDEGEEPEPEQEWQKAENYIDFNPEKTGDDYRQGGSQFNGELSEWMGKRFTSNQNIVKTDHSAAIESDVPPIPSLKCLDQPPSKFVSVIVEVSEADGRLVEDAESPYALNSTGHHVLDKQALEIAKSIDYQAYFNPDEPAPGYWFNIPVDYDDSGC
ncbi:MAG: energy transducer TonB [Cyanobacteria bacterium P01_D01_bin.156]